MTALADPVEDAPKSKSKLPLLLGLVLALAGGGGGFFAVSSGMLLGGAGAESHAADGHATEDTGHAAEGHDDHASDAHGAETGGTSGLANVAFIPLDPLIISIPSTNGTRFLRFTAQLEVPPKYQSDVAAVMPRVVDVLNGYLRAVELDELADPTVLVRLRGQMLRRVQVVTGQDQVRDLLIMEFVLN